MIKNELRGALLRELNSTRGVKRVVIIGQEDGVCLIYIEMTWFSWWFRPLRTEAKVYGVVSKSMFARICGYQLRVYFF